LTKYLFPFTIMQQNVDYEPVGGMMAKQDRGFASMDRAKQREIAAKGGKASHQKGTAHQWTSEEARAAGRKGGTETGRRRRKALLDQQQPLLPEQI
jgi:general stress protein YciG